MKKMNLGFIMVGLVFLISIPSNSSTTIKNKENPWSYCYSDDLRFLQSKKEGRGISVFLYTRCTEQKYKLLINYSLFVFHKFHRDVSCSLTGIYCD